MGMRIGVQNTGESMSSMKLRPSTLAAMVKMIESKAISGKIGKQLLPELLQVLSQPSHF